jgi:hypothetical protein
LPRERLEKLQAHVLRLGVPPASFLPVVCDITKDAEVAALPKIVAKRWPDCGIDVLVRVQRLCASFRTAAMRGAAASHCPAACEARRLPSLRCLCQGM